MFFRKILSLLWSFSLIILLSKTAFAAETKPKKKEITLDVSLSFESDNTTKSNDGYVALDFITANKDFRFLTNIDYSEDYANDSSGVEIKTKELIDIEQKVNYNFPNQKHYLTSYYNYKKDEANDDSEQNYQILSVGYGRKLQINKFTFSGEISLGGRTSNENDEVIYRPSVTVEYKSKKFTLKIVNSYIEGEDFSEYDFTSTAGHPLTERITLKLINKFEKSDTISNTEYERLNSLALSFKF